MSADGSTAIIGGLDDNNSTGAAWIFIASSLTTGIIDISNPNQQYLSCYPSPTSGSFTIDMTGYSGGEKQIRVYDQLGQVVYQTQSSMDKLQVSDKLSAGLYTVMVTQDSQRAYARVLVE